MSNSLNGRKVAVIGCGFVGSTTAYSLMQSKLFTDMVLILSLIHISEPTRH